jgi:hypothetical protein
MKIYSKKSESTWISFVLLIGLLLFIGAFIFGFVKGMSESQIEVLEEKVNSMECDDLVLKLQSYCQKLESVNFIFSNPSNKNIDSIRIRMFDIYGNVYNKEISQGLHHNSFLENRVVLKDGVIATLELIPILEEKESLVICNNKKIVLNKIDFCND